MDINRLQKQVDFIIEIDKLKDVYRQTFLINGKRNENDAEHSWHIAMIAILFQEYITDRSFDMARVLKMLLIHDLVEIDAGDTFAYDVEGNKDKKIREQAAAERLFGMLPSDQRDEFFELWNEFEKQITIESKIARAVDCFQPILHNYKTEGRAWKHHHVTHSQVIKRNKHIADASPVLWKYAKNMIDDALAKGYLE